jgi:predicted peroxiredoxin
VVLYLHITGAVSVPLKEWLCCLKDFSKKQEIIAYCRGPFCVLADAASCAIAGQTTPNGYYNIERMMKFSINIGSKLKICGSCADARGLKNAELIKGTEISTMAELTEWVVDSDKVITF